MTGKTVLGLALAFAIGVLVPAGAAAPQAGQDISGVWTVTMELADAKPQVDATVKQTGEKIQVSLTLPSGTFELAGTMVNNELSVTHMLKIQEVTGEVKMTGTLADDRFAGNIDFLGQSNTAAACFCHCTSFSFLCRRDDHAVLALDRLQDHHRGLVGDRRAPAPRRRRTARG